MENEKLVINTVDEALGAIQAIERFMMKHQREHCKRKEYLDICGDLASARWEIAKHCRDN